MSSNDFLNLLGNCFAAISAAEALPLAMLTAGLVGGFTHCIPMCGGFVFAQTKEFKKASDVFMIPYHLGRITTYIFMAVLLAAFLNLAFLFMPIRELIIAPLLFMASAIFFINAFPSLKKIFPWGNGIRIPLVEKLIARRLPRLSQKGSILNRYLMGIMLGFIPCGLTLSAYMAAASAPNIIVSVISMAAFGLGTTVSLVFSAFGYSALQRRFPHKMHRVTDALAVISGLWLFAMASFLLI